MAVISNIGTRVINYIPSLVAKVGSVLLFIFTVGLFVGHYIASQKMPWLLLLVPIVSMFVMWKKLDEGVLVLVLLTLFILTFPEFFVF